MPRELPFPARPRSTPSGKRRGRRAHPSAGREPVAAARTRDRCDPIGQTSPERFAGRRRSRCRSNRRKAAPRHSPGDASEPGHERWCNERPTMAQPDPRLEKRLLHDVGRAIRDFDLVQEGDRILVAVSGGKDSFTLLHLLRELRRRAPVRFDLVACNLDQGHPGFPAARLEAYLREQEVEVRMLREDTYSQVLRLTPPGKTLCTVCSRLRRGILYSAAQEMGCTKIALGHHRDDLVESLLLSMLFTGKMRSMPPRLVSDDGRNVVIRPLCYAAEADIAEFARSAAFPIIP